MDAAVDDDALMAQARAGSRHAFGQLVHRHEAKVRAYLVRALDDVEEAKDVCQDVFVEVWQRRDRYEPQGKFVGWLFAIARSRATSRGRFRAVRRLFAQRAREGDDDAPTPADALVQRRREASVRAALRALPPTLRDAVALHHAAGLDHATVAGLLGIDPAAARQRSARGIARLRELLHPDDLDAAVAGMKSQERT